MGALTGEGSGKARPWGWTSFSLLYSSFPSWMVCRVGLEVQFMTAPPWVPQLLVPSRGGSTLSGQVPPDRGFPVSAKVCLPAGWVPGLPPPPPGTWLPGPHT